MNVSASNSIGTAANDLSRQTGAMVDQAATTAGHLADAAKADVDQLLQSAPNKIKSAVERSINAAESMAHRGLESAREAGASVRHQVGHAGERTVSYIQAEPVKSVLMAAAVGAASAALIGWMARARTGQ